ncbi:MAG: histone deacetylase [Cyanobacteria bacterium SZAS LIN-2]|nr:histone deacetylase [Cyanobacteria bacterium SZAS LIN-2]
MESSSNTNLVFSPAYNTDLPAYGLDKPFALDRGQLVLAKLGQDLGRKLHYLTPEPLTMGQVRTVHSEKYLQSLGDVATWLAVFELKENDLKKAGATKPITQMIDDFLLKAGGTLLAARLAVKHGLAANLGGGYHHAFPDRGHGFCVINDIAIAIRCLRQENLVGKVMIVDVDFHQGDGTAVTFADDAEVFTLSVHSQEGWPDEKQKSSLDVGILESEKDQYVSRTRAALKQALGAFTPDLVIFVAGSDAYEKDILPGTRYLRLPLAVLKERDEFIIDTFADRKIPLAMVFAGGYGPDVWEVHYNAVKQLLVRSGITFDGVPA